MKPTFNPRLARLGAQLLTAGSLLCLSACGGGGAGGLIAGISGAPSSGGGIGGTGLVSSGTIDGTGSIFVNGVRFDVDNAEIFIDGEPATDDQLGLGMVVNVEGTVSDDDVNGVANRIDYNPQLEGPVSALERNQDNSSARLTILGQEVIVERTSTVFKGISFDALTAGDILEVSGYRDDRGRLRATRVEAQDDLSGNVKISGVISNLSGQRFTIGSQAVDATDAMLDDLPGDVLANGVFVKAEGPLVGGVIQAGKVEGRDELSIPLQVDDQITVQGSISQFDGGSGFVVQGLTIDASNATISTGGLPLGNSAVVEVAGIWDGNKVVASSISARRGRIKVEAPLADINGGTLSFAFANEQIGVATDARTLFDDDRDDIEFLKVSDLAIGDYLEVEALNNNGSLLATRVDRDEDDDESELQGPVESFVDGISVTVLGITFDVTRAEFENAADETISAAEFFANLSVGALLSIEDDIPSDGFAEHVEFEFATVLDGEREFDDDDQERIGEEDLPASVLSYLAANYPTATIAFIKRDDNEIEVYLTNGTAVVFDLSGNFIEADDDKDDEDDDSDADDLTDDDDNADDSADDNTDDDDNANDDDSTDDNTDDDDDSTGDDDAP